MRGGTTSHPRLQKCHCKPTFPGGSQSSSARCRAPSISSVGVRMAPRPNWKGYLKLSLVSCCKKTGNRIRYKKVDAETEEEVDSSDIIKGYQVDKNVYVQVEDEEIEALRVEATHTIEIEKFVPLSQIDARYYD